LSIECELNPIERRLLDSMAQEIQAPDLSRVCLQVDIDDAQALAAVRSLLRQGLIVSAAAGQSED
jgi:hypothetical protein